jgi:hypothetical protein
MCACHGKRETRGTRRVKWAGLGVALHAAQQLSRTALLRCLASKHVHLRPQPLPCCCPGARRGVLHTWWRAAQNLLPLPEAGQHLC